MQHLQKTREWGVLFAPPQSPTFRPAESSALSPVPCFSSSLPPYLVTSLLPYPLRSQPASPCYHRPCCLRSSQESEPGMTARILDGTKIRDQIFAELSDEVRLLTAARVRPGLAAVLVRDNPASPPYVQSQIAACEQLGLSSALLTPPATAT